LVNRALGEGRPKKRGAKMKSVCVGVTSQLRETVVSRAKLRSSFLVLAVGGGRTYQRG